MRSERDTGLRFQRPLDNVLPAVPKSMRDAFRHFVAWTAREKRAFRIDEIPAIVREATGVTPPTSSIFGSHPCDDDAKTSVGRTPTVSAS